MVGFAAVLYILKVLQRMLKPCYKIRYMQRAYSSLYRDAMLFGLAVAIAHLLHYYSLFDFLETNIESLLWGSTLFFAAWVIIGLAICGMTTRRINSLVPWESISSSR